MYSPIESLHELKQIAQSQAFRILLDERKDFAQKEVNRFVREQKFTEAYASLARLDDLNKLMDLVYQKIEETQKEIK